MLDRQIEDTVVRERLLAMLSIFFAVVAALLALLGLYGVIAYGVTKRTNEIGVRIALGAGRGAVLTMILREAAVLITAGIAAGAGDRPGRRQALSDAALRHHAARAHHPGDCNRSARGGRTTCQLLAGAGCDED